PLKMGGLPGDSCQPYLMVLVESMLEKDYCFHLEESPDVLRYYPQPKTYQLNSERLKNRSYTPDFEIHFRDGGKSFVEVKKDFSNLDEIYLHKLDVAEKEMMMDGYHFFRVDEVAIRTEPLLSNLKRLQRYRRSGLDNDGLLVTLKGAVPNPEILRDLVSNRAGIRTETIYRLIAEGKIKVDLTREEISLESEVSYA
ncbi:MAG: TnsA endonuclease N-terminal domain-containing protein, partial [Methylococcales bacterium]|nr:TnsA endonuclease N-terminal domain-containing protein [Methylococcales bacterium]